MPQGVPGMTWPKCKDKRTNGEPCGLPLDPKTRQHRPDVQRLHDQGRARPLTVASFGNPGGATDE